MPKWSMPKYRSFVFYREQAIEGERRSTYQCMPAVLNSLFFFFFSLITSYFSFSFVLLPFLLNDYFWVMVFPKNSYYCDFSNPLPQCTARGPLYRACHDQYLLFQPLTAFVWCGCPCRPLTGHQLFSHYYLLVLTMPLPSLSDKECYFVSLLAVAFLPVTVCVLSLSLSIHHGIHLVVPTHPYFFWVACHPSRTFPPKEPK